MSKLSKDSIYELESIKECFPEVLEAEEMIERMKAKKCTYSDWEDLMAMVGNIERCRLMLRILGLEKEANKVSSMIQTFYERYLWPLENAEKRRKEKGA